MTKEEKNKYNEEYRLKNKEKISEQQKKWYNKNKNRKKDYNEEYCLKNKEKIKNQRQQYNIDNKEKNQQYYENNKEKILKNGKEYYENNKEKVLENCKLYRKNNKEKIKKLGWLYNLKRYNITENEYYVMFNKQNGCCLICETPVKELSSSLHIDHCHDTGKIRGLLCSKCNQGLGLFNDDITLLNKSIEYLNGKL